MLKSASTDQPIRKRPGIIDCDVHVSPKNINEIRAYMKPPFRNRYSGGGRGFFGNPIQGGRIDAKPPNGDRAGSNPEFLREQLIDEYGIAHAILLPRAFCNLQPDPDFGIAIAGSILRVIRRQDQTSDRD